MKKLIFLTYIIFISFFSNAQNNLRSVQNRESNKTKELCGSENDNYNNKTVYNCVNPYTMIQCSFPESRDSFIPDALTSVKYFSLLIIVVDSNTYGVTQENVDFMMSGVNNFFAPWKMNFCYSTVFIDGSMVSQYPQNKDSVINVIISDWPNLGLSGNPIKIDYSVVINDDYHGGYSLAHEIGHDFNLAHTFSSNDVPTTDNNLGCSSPCRDRVDYATSLQDTVGDWISDTPPTPKNSNCASPTGVDSCSVGMPSWPAWGYENIMGYSYCSNATFSPQQAGRMHCISNYGASPYSIIKHQKLLAYGMLHCSTSSTILNYINDKNIYFDVFPNPFKESTTINFNIQQDGIVSLELYNSIGQKVTDLFNEKVDKEQQKKIVFFTNNLSSGIYFAKLKSENKVITKRMMITK